MNEGEVEATLQRVCDLLTKNGGPPFPPAPQTLIIEAERQLGFPLPVALRRLYSEVGNGGFGPFWGICGLPGGATNTMGMSIIEMYLDDRRYCNNSERGIWPERLVSLCDYGCGIWWCVDCSNPDGAVIWSDPNAGGPCEQWFEPISPSLCAWLDDWLDGRSICGQSVKG